MTSSMNAEKWRTVGSNKNKLQSSKRDAKATKTTGIQESSNVFSQFGSLHNREAAENRVQSGRPSSSVTDSFQGVGSSAETSSGVKKKSGSKKSKAQQERISFDEQLYKKLILLTFRLDAPILLILTLRRIGASNRNLDASALQDFIEDVQSKLSDNPQKLLKEISGYLETSFQKSEVEKDFTFSNCTPGFPFSSLPESCQDPLQAAVGSCPPLAQESTFLYCVDRLLSKVKVGLPSYGTRIMLQLLILTNPSTCSEATGRIKLLLESSISKVPEALSLLWVGLPHPELHPFAVAVLGAWPDLCLPLLYNSNVPKQVLSYAVGYTCLLLRHVGGSVGPELLKAVTPQVLCEVLTSPQLVGKKNAGNVSELFQLLQESLFECCSPKQLCSYFSRAFKHMEEQSSQVLLSFAVDCLSKSSGSFRVWEQLFPKHPQSSVLLVQQLYKNLPSTVSLQHLDHTLKVLMSRGSPEERELAKEILSRHAAAFAKARSQSQPGSDSLHRDHSHQTRGSGSWCSLCGLLVLILAAAYLYLLGLFLRDLATNGPDGYIDRIKVHVVDYADIKLASNTMLAWLKGVLRLVNHYVINFLF